MVLVYVLSRAIFTSHTSIYSTLLSCAVATITQVPKKSWEPVAGLGLPPSHKIHTLGKHGHQTGEVFGGLVVCRPYA